MKHIKLEYDQLYEFTNLKSSVDDPQYYQYNLKLFNHIFKHDYVPLDYNEVVTYLNSLNEDNMHFIDLMHTSITIEISVECFKTINMIYKNEREGYYQYTTTENFFEKRDVLKGDVYIIHK